MTTIAMLVLGYPFGARTADFRRAARWLAIAFTILLAFQTTAVAAEGDLSTFSDVLIYTAINAASLALGLLLSRWAVHRTQARRSLSGQSA